MKCLIYKSIPSKELKDRMLKSMLDTAKKFNRDNDITGCIFINHEKIVQLIEGEEEKIEELYYRIIKDSRHHTVELLLEKEVYKRSMKDWSMAVYNTTGDGSNSDFTKLSLLEKLHKSSNIDIINTITNELPT